MPETLLATKLFIPPLPPKILDRVALVEALAKGLSPEKRLILVCAPAGYGKTTLVCNWLRNTPNVCWVSLDEGDNDANLFLSYLAASLQKSFPSVGPKALGLLSAPQPPAPQVVLSELLNDIVTIGEQIILVLDDYQLIHSRPIHEGLTFFIDHLPPNAHIVITSRSDPALPLHRYRSRGQMLEIRADALRFSVEETAGFLREIAGISLALPEVTILEQRTEGWIAGLQMAALSLRGKLNAAQFIHSLAGTNRYILDYLVEEALNNQTSAIQEFLVNTSILDRLSAPLCAAVLETDEISSVGMLAELEQANLFLIPLDDERFWYRYHHLFRDLLLMRLKQSGVDVRKLHQRAAKWCESNGQVSEAIRYFISAEDFEHAAELVERHTFALFAQGELHQLVGWIRKLPSELAARRPWLCIYQAWALAFAGKNSEAEALIETAIQAMGGEKSGQDTQQEIWDEINALRGLMAITWGNLQKALEINELPDPAGISPRSSRRWVLGYSLRMQGKLEAAASAFRDMLAIGQQMNNIWTISTASVDLGAVLRLSGRLAEAEKVYRTGLEAMQRAGARGLGFAGRLESFLANTLYEQNQVEDARKLVSDAIAHNALWENPNHVVHGHLTLARILFGLGDLVGVNNALQQAEANAAHPAVIPSLKAGSDGLRVRLWQANGQLNAIEHWLKSDPLAAGAIRANTETTETYVLVKARALMALGQPEKAYEILEGLEQDTRAGGRINTLIEALTLKALFAPNRSAALAALDAALQLGVPAGYRRVFLDEGEPLKAILADLVGRSEQAQVLLDAVPDEPSLLTPREMDILRAMAEGLSNKEIGSRYYISAGTVKAHSAAIYRKLEAANRTEAIAKAKDLGLL